MIIPKHCGADALLWTVEGYTPDGGWMSVPMWWMGVDLPFGAVTPLCGGWVLHPCVSLTCSGPASWVCVVPLLEVLGPDEEGGN